MFGGLATLADGTSGAVVNLASAIDNHRGKAEGSGPVVATTVRDKIWVLKQGGTYATVRNAQSGEVIQRVDVLDQCLAIAAVPTTSGSYRVWISTVTGKMHIFGEEGTLVGLLQAASLPVATRLYPMPLEAGNILLSSSPGKDVALWDTSQFAVIRSYFGKVPGEQTTDVAALDPQCSLFAVATTATVRLWGRQQGTVVCELADTGASCLCADFSFAPRPYSENQPGMLGAYLWVAQRSVVTVYAVVAIKSSTAAAPTIQLIREKVLPCPNACQLVRTTPKHIVAMDTGGLVSVWSVEDFGPVRTFQADAFISPSSKSAEESISDKSLHTRHRPFLVVPAITKATRLCWTFGSDDKALLWSDESAPLNTMVGGGDGGGALTATNTGASTNRQGSGVSKDMEREEITFLRRKLKYLETMATLYRQKVGMLFREKGGPMLQQRATTDGDASKIISTFNEIDGAYMEALGRYEQQTLEQEPLPDYLVGAESSDGYGGVGQPPQPGQSAEDFVDYWRRKCQEAKSDMQRLKDDYESMMELFFLGNSGNDPVVGGAGSDKGDLVVRSPKGKLVNIAAASSSLQSETDVKRAHHVCQLIREKNAVRERERQLLEDVTKLRAKLREFNSPLASRGPLEDAETLKQQNEDLRAEVKSLRTSLDGAQTQVQQLQSQAKQAALIKARLAKMQAAVDEAEIKLSTRTAELQADIDGVLEKFYGAQKTIDRQTATVKAAQNAKHEAELQSLKRQQTIESLTQELSDLEKQLTRQKESDEQVIDRLRTEIQHLCDAVTDRDGKIIEWQSKFEATEIKLRDVEMEAASLRYLVDSKETEIGVLMERIAHLESIIQERKMYAETISEVQGRMELIIEELRHAFTPSEFAASMGKLEDRMANLIAVEQQLRHKDDIIAMKEDDIRLLKENAAALESHVHQISSVFLQLPQSVEEVEALLIEVDEYRRRLGVDPNIQTAVRQRLMELFAKKRTKSAISALDMDLLQAGGMSRAETSRGQPDNEELEKAKVLADALRAVAGGAAREVKTGLVGAKPSIPYTLHPVHQNRTLPEVVPEPEVQPQPTTDASQINE